MWDSTSASKQSQISLFPSSFYCTQVGFYTSGESFKEHMCKKTNHSWNKVITNNVDIQCHRQGRLIYEAR